MLRIPPCSWENVCKTSIGYYLISELLFSASLGPSAFVASLLEPRSTKHLTAEMTTPENLPMLTPGDHKAFMLLAVEKASFSPPSPSKFCVGAVLANGVTGEVLSTGYSIELPGDMDGDLGSTHAEQCCFIKFAQQHTLPVAHAEEHIGQILPGNTVLYTTMEPCNARLSGRRTCCDRIVALKDRLKTVYVGIREPNTFMANNDGKARLEREGIAFEMVEGVHDFCFEAAMAGHEKKD